MCLSSFSLFLASLQAQHPFASSLNPMNEVLPPAPTAAALALYGEVPVSLYTGIPSISVPLCGVRAGSLSVPLSLSYQGGGYQVDAVSSWVGLGWSLNAGGVVTRTVNGIEDDHAQQGYWAAGLPDDYPVSSVNPTDHTGAYAAQAFFDYVQEAATGDRDGQPDQFNFNIGGYSGRFYIERTASGTLVPRLVPHQDIQIELIRPNSTLEGLVLTTPDGVRYFFGGVGLNGVACVEKSKTYTAGINCARDYDLPVITSWYLRAIKSPDGQDSISLLYAAHTLRYEASIAESHSYTQLTNSTGGNNTFCAPAYPAQSTCIHDISVNGIHLIEIRGAQERVALEVDTSIRQDLAGGGVRLAALEKYGTGNPDYLRRYELVQDYFVAHSSDPTVPDRSKRLRLLSVQEIGAGNDRSIPAHTFEYESTPLPPRLSKARDFWGYYNGQNSNLSLIPASLPTQANFYPNGGNRYPDAAYAKAGILQKINYPTGGHTVLAYEGHERSYATPINEVQAQTTAASAWFYQGPDTAISPSFTTTHTQDVAIKVAVTYRCGAPAPIVSYLKIEEKINGIWQPITSASHPNINSGGSGNDGPGTIDLGNPTVEIINYQEDFVVNDLPAGEYRVLAMALQGTTNNSACTQDDELSIQVHYETETGNLVYGEPVGGVRIKTIRTHDGLDANKDIVKAYTYGTLNNPDQSSGVAVRQLDFDRTSLTETLETSPNCNSPSCVNYKCEQRTITKFAQSQVPLHGVSGGHIAYTEVTVLNGLNGEQGKTWNRFDVAVNTSANLGAELAAPLSLTDWLGGNLLEQIVYKNEQGTFTKVSQQLNEYTVNSIHNDSTLHTFYGMAVGVQKRYTNLAPPIPIYTFCDGYNTNPVNQPGHQVGGIYYPHVCEGHNPGDYFVRTDWISNYAYVYYPIFSGQKQLTRSVARQYDEGGIDYLETVTTYTYDPVYTHLKRTQTTNSDGTIYATEYQYPTDYDTYTQSTDPMALAINRLKDLHQHSTIIEQTNYQQKVGQAEQLLAGMITTFEIDSNNANRVVPTTIYRSELAAPMDRSSFVGTRVNFNAGFLYDTPVYTAYGRYLGHNEQGRPLGFQVEGDLPNSYLWGYQAQVPVLKAVNAHPTEIGCISFEAGEASAWTTSTTLPHTVGKIGQAALQTAQEFPVQQVFQVDGQQKRYKFSAWVKTSGSGYLVLRTCAAGSAATYPDPASAPSYQQVAFSATGGQWQLVDVELDLAAIRQAAGLPASEALAVHAYAWNPTQSTLELDALRFHPSDAFVETHDYEQATLQTTTIEGVNRLHSHYAYDNFQRLSHVTDFEGNIVGANSYHYKGSGSLENHVKTQVLRVGGKTSLAALVGLPLEELTESYSYSDGLGRPIQTVGKGASTTQHDIVTFTEYDAFGRVTKNHLPYVNTTKSNGGFDVGPLAKQQQFYAVQVPQATQSGFAYSETRFEPSPLDRPKEQSVPGEGWQVGGGHSTQTAYALNASNEVLYLDEQTTTPQYYAPHTLTKVYTINPKGDTTISYSDKMGRMVLVKQQLDTIWVQTYTLYNDFGLTKAVIPPSSVVQMLGANNYNYQTSPLYYEYTYDDHQRLTQKQLPDGVQQWYVYDQLDRVVATQDNNQQAQEQWLITKYDQYGRPIITALYKSSLEQADLQAIFDQYTTVFEQRAATTTGYTNTLPALGVNDSVLTVQYYDDYDFDRDGAVDASNNFVVQAGYGSSYFKRLDGQLTGSKTRLLDGTGQYLKQVVFYDERGRVIQTKADNPWQGEERSHQAYDFIGNLLKTYVYHITNPSKTEEQAFSTEEFFTYDHANRLLQIKHTIDDQDTILLVDHQYDILGRLSEKNLHSTNTGATYLQSIDYHYNIKNWLTRINDLYPILPTLPEEGDGPPPSTPEDNADLLLMNFEYDYGGNIRHLEWRAHTHAYRSMYDYQYDALDRLKAASYKEYIEASPIGAPSYQRQGHYSVSGIEYDLMGNILQLKRQGTIAVSGTNLTNGVLDELTYSYSGNRLQAVEDGGSATMGFQDGASSAIEYHYDANGNLTEDLNKGINIAYNHLNLPHQIDFNGGEALSWIYDATGQKWHKRADDGSSGLLTRTYMGKAEYNNGTLQFVQHSEGRILRTLTGYNIDNQPIYDYHYEYALKDHLGNNRVYFSDRNKNGTIDPADDVLQQEHYYPYGMTMRGEWKFNQPQLGTVNGYQYNGKELNEDFDLNWSDYGARWYDASLGRWHVVDPLAEDYVPWSGYNYVLGNPIQLVDPDGMAPKTVKPVDKKALETIKNTLPQNAREFVVLNDKGLIDGEKLREFSNTGNSNNFNALLEIVEHKEVFEVHVVEGDHLLAPLFVHNGKVYEDEPQVFGEVRTLTDEEKAKGYNGEPAYNLSTNEATEGNIGLTIPKSMSRSKNYEIIINGHLSEKGQVETAAHEIYGHALFIVAGKASGHKITIERGEQNIELRDQIIDATQEAIKNYENE